MQVTSGRSPIVPEKSYSDMPSAVVSSITLSSGAAPSTVSPTPHSLLYGDRPPLMPMSLQLPRFADKDFVPSSIQSVLVATRICPSSPGSRASTDCVNMDVFTSERSGSSNGCSPVSPVEGD